MTPEERNELADLIGDECFWPLTFTEKNELRHAAAAFIRTAVPWEVVEPIVEFTADAAELDQWKPEGTK